MHLALYLGGGSGSLRAVGLSEEQLTDDLRRAMKARDMTVVYVLRAVTAAAKNLKVEKRTSELSEGELFESVRRELK